jgi:hypothetical protein
MAHLLDPRDVLGDVLDADRVLHRQSMTLALHAGFVNEDSSVGSETCA